MKASSFRYLLNQGLKSVWTNRMMSFASFCIITVSLLMVGLSVLATLNISKIIGNIEAENEVVIQIFDEAPQEVIDSLSEALNTNPNLTKITFYSGVEAWANMLKDMTEQQRAVIDYGEDTNPLPDTFRVSVKDVSKMKTTADEIALLEGVETVKAPNDFADMLTRIRTIIAIISLAIVVALTVVCMVIISNTTRASVFARRKEINIMKYVGATNSFIKIPFFVEGMSIGILAAGGALLVTKFAYEAIFNVLNENLQRFTFIGMSSLITFDNVYIQLGISYIVAGAVIGAFGCVFSTRKHLRV